MEQPEKRKVSNSLFPYYSIKESGKKSNSNIAGIRKEKKAGKLTKKEWRVILQIEQREGEEARTFKRKTGLLSNKGRRPLHEHKERLL